MFEFLQIRGYFQKVVKSDGRVVKNETTGLLWNDSGFDWTAKCSEFIGRVFKNGGPRNSSATPATPALPAKLPELSRHPQLGATHPHAPGARMT